MAERPDARQPRVKGRGVSRRFLAVMGIVLVSVLGGGAVSASPGQSMVMAKTRTGPFVLLVVIDAARADEVNLAQMPNVARLEQMGTTYTDAWVGQLPSITEASHATLGTGVFPREHGILGDTWRVPGTAQMAPNLLNGALDRTGYIGKAIQQAKVPTLAGLVHRRLPGSLVVALSGHKVYAADGLGAGAADFVGFGGKDKRGHFVPEAIPGHEPVKAILTSPQLDLPTVPKEPGLEDQWTTTLAEKYLFKYHPRVMMINLPEVDIAGHANGTDATVMQPLMSNVDRQIGRLVAAYQRAGMLSQTTIVVTADHGMVPDVHNVDIASIQSAVRSAGASYLYVGHGDFSEIYLRNSADTPKVAQALVNASIPNVVAVYAKNGQGQYAPASPGTSLASPAVNLAYSDLLGTLDSPESADIVLLYAENTITMTPNFARIGRKGDHEGATWGSQHIPLIVEGPGIRQNYRSPYAARLVDIPVTLEAVLGIRASGQNGVPLADAMLKPPKWASAAQDSAAARMNEDVAALQVQAAADTH